MTLGETPRPQEFTPSQQIAIAHLIGPENSAQFENGLFPAAFTLSDFLFKNAIRLLTSSIRENVEYGMQYWVEPSQPELTEGEVYKGKEGEIHTQSDELYERLSSVNTPTIDFHTHPKLFDPNMPNNFSRSQFPSDEDIAALIEERHLVGMIVSTVSGHSCLLKHPSLYLIQHDAELSYPAPVRAANDASLALTGFRIARSIRPYLGLYHTYDRSSARLQYIKTR